jgi:CubicO group peptidase (beta-lactamase class C family)
MGTMLERQFTFVGDTFDHADAAAGDLGEFERAGLEARNLMLRQVALIGVLTAAVSVPILAPSIAVGANAATPSASDLDAIVRKSMTDNHMRAAIVEVRRNGQDVYVAAFGDSMAGVPATTDMHFRNGALAFTYMATLLLELVDQKKTTLDTKLSTYFPDYPNANAVSLRNLAQMTSGYADYVYQDEFQNALYSDPFKQWTPEELIRIGVSKPIQFAPGTNWGYSHTNYVILGRVLEKIAGLPLADVIQQFVLQPMKLHQTTASTTPEIPQPVLHSFTSERRSPLGINPGVPFTEEATYWNPSWTTVEGAVETTDIADLCTSLEAVGSGSLLSPASHAAQVASSLIGFGHTQPHCPACRTMTSQFNYGIGVINSGPWVSQTLGFAGASGAVA